MAKLFVFGIGGTGSRVIKSLTMLLSAGVELGEGIDTVVPMIIDPDVANGDLTRTQQLLQHYQRIHDQTTPASGFFSTPIRTLSEIATIDGPQVLQNNFNLLEGIGDQNQTFQDYIGYGNLSKENKALIELLFSPENLKANMSVGFKGHPNIGAVVLNQFKQDPSYQVFLNSFAPGDSVFLISSIFGGTGAAGFPLLLRNLRTPDADFPNSDVVAAAPIGAISMLPYFKVNTAGDSKQTIDSSTFVGKAKAALDYYSHSIFGNNNQLNAFYSIGEDATNFYDHNDGAQGQKNKAHFLELASALAVVDFSRRLPQMSTANNKASSTDYLEFGVEDLEGARHFNLKKIGRESVRIIGQALAKFSLMALFNNHVLENIGDFEKSPWYMHVKDCYQNNGLYESDLSKVEHSFKDWIQEMGENDIKFDPIERNISYSNLLNLVNGYQMKRSIIGNSANGKRLDKELNAAEKKLSSQDNTGADLINLFNQATESLISNVINN